MGRWSQRQRRSTAESLAPVTPPPVIVDVIVDSASNARVSFNQAVTFGTNASDSLLQIDGVGSDSQSTAGATEIALQSSAGLWAPGQPWSLSGQPAWLADAIVTPVGGTTS